MCTLATRGFADSDPRQCGACIRTYPATRAANQMVTVPGFGGVILSEAQEKVTRGNEGEPISRVEGCSVVFGRKARQALEMRRSGKSKAEVESETGSTIGVYQADFEVYPS